MRSLSEIIVHCSATPEGHEVSVATIDQWHKARKWSGIGYHYVIYLDGSIHEGRPLNQVGAHVAGRNRGTIGICYIGGVALDGKTPKDTRTAAQKKALESLIISLMGKYPTINKVSGHRDYAAKACPSFDATREYANLVGSKSGDPLVAKTGNKNAGVLEIQELLSEKGYPVGAIDGMFGKLTRDAVLAFQHDNSLDVDGVVGPNTLKALRASPPRMFVRSMDSMDKLRLKGSRTIAKADSGQKVASLAGGGGVALMALDKAPEIIENIEKAQGLYDRMSAIAPPVLGLILVAFAGWAVYCKFSEIKDARLEDHRSGAHRGR